VHRQPGGPMGNPKKGGAVQREGHMKGKNLQTSRKKKRNSSKVQRKVHQTGEGPGRTLGLGGKKERGKRGFRERAYTWGEKGRNSSIPKDDTGEVE